MSWDSLLNILGESRALAEEEASREPEICPNDATLLERDPEGRLRCPFDGWTP